MAFNDTDLSRSEIVRLVQPVKVRDSVGAEVSTIRFLAHEHIKIGSSTEDRRYVKPVGTQDHLDHREADYSVSFVEAGDDRELYDEDGIVTVHRFSGF